MRKNVDFTVLNESLKPYLHLKHTIWLLQSKSHLQWWILLKKGRLNRSFK